MNIPPVMRPFTLTESFCAALIMVAGYNFSYRSLFFITRITKGLIRKGLVVGISLTLHCISLLLWVYLYGHILHFALFLSGVISSEGSEVVRREYGSGLSRGPLYGGQAAIVFLGAFFGYLFSLTPLFYLLERINRVVYKHAAGEILPAEELQKKLCSSCRKETKHKYCFRKCDD